MSETPEGKVKRKIRELLAEYGVYVFMPVQVGYGSRTLDFLGCINGRFFAIEAKAPGKKMTEQQCEIARQMTLAGAAVFSISSTDLNGSEFHALRSWLHSASGRTAPTRYAPA